MTTTSCAKPDIGFLAAENYVKKNHELKQTRRDCYMLCVKLAHDGESSHTVRLERGGKCIEELVLSLVRKRLPTSLPAYTTLASSKVKDIGIQKANSKRFAQKH